MKKFLLVFLSALILFSGISVCAYDDEMSRQDIQTVLSKLNILNGYPDGNFYPDKNVSRAEFSKIAVMASPYRDYVASGMNTSPFPDVQFTHWSAPFVKVASVNKLIVGYPDSTFKPDNNVLMEEAVTVVIKMLGYSDEDFMASWPYGQIGVAKNIGLLDGVSAVQGQYMSRGDVATLIYNTLRTKPKNAQQSTVEYISTIGFNLIENTTILATAKEDSSVGTNKVSTTAGTYKIDQSFDYECVGKKGYILVNDSNEFLAFIGDSSTTVNYTVYSVLTNEIVAYKDGGLVSLKLSDNLTAYYKLKTSTVGQLKNSLKTGYLLSVAYDMSGNPEYVTINDGELEGPVTVMTNGLSHNYGLTTNATVIRDGNRSRFSEISKYDIVYYSTALDMLWAYSKKVTGTYEEALPNRDAVSSIKIGGTTYQIESADAAAKLSSSGDFVLGDTVTVMIGKDGGIAGVISPENVTNNVYGYVTATGTSEFSDSDGNITSSRYVQIVHTDGSVVKYKTKHNYSSYLHSAVKIKLSNGYATIKSLNNGSISGVVDYDSRTIDSIPISESVNILEVTTTEPSENASYKKIFLNRLDGLNLKASEVLYSAKDSKGRITDLILLNATGDAFKYGIVSDIVKGSELGSGGVYSIYVGTQPITINSQNKKFNVSEGQPIKVFSSGNSVDTITGLSMVNGKITDITAAYVETTDKIYNISDDCIVYNSQYGVLTIDEALSRNDLKYYAYIDNYSSTVRVIKALDK